MSSAILHITITNACLPSLFAGISEHALGFAWPNDTEPLQSLKMVKIRIRIREQLCLLITVTTLLALTVLAVSTWVQTAHFMRRVRSETLKVTANLKASQLAEDLTMLKDLVQSISTRDTLQLYLHEFNDGNRSDQVFESIQVLHLTF